MAGLQQPRIGSDFELAAGADLRRRIAHIVQQYVRADAARSRTLAERLAEFLECVCSKPALFSARGAWRLQQLAVDVRQPLRVKSSHPSVLRLELLDLLLQDVGIAGHRRCLLWSCRILRAAHCGCCGCQHQAAEVGGELPFHSHPSSFVDRARRLIPAGDAKGRNTDSVSRQRSLARVTALLNGCRTFANGEAAPRSGVTSHDEGNGRVADAPYRVSATN